MTVEVLGIGQRKWCERKLEKERKKITQGLGHDFIAVFKGPSVATLLEH